MLKYTFLLPQFSVSIWLCPPMLLALLMAPWDSGHSEESSTQTAQGNPYQSNSTEYSTALQLSGPSEDSLASRTLIGGRRRKCVLQLKKPYL